MGAEALALLFALAAPGAAPAAPPAEPPGVAPAWTGRVTYLSQHGDAQDGGDGNVSSQAARAEYELTLLPGTPFALVEARVKTTIEAVETESVAVPCEDGGEALAARTRRQSMRQGVDGLGLGEAAIVPGEGGRYVLALKLPAIAGGLTELETFTSGRGGCDGAGGPGLEPPRTLTLQEWQEPALSWRVEGAFDPAAPGRAHGAMTIGGTSVTWDLVRRGAPCEEVRSARTAQAAALSGALAGLEEDAARVEVLAAAAAVEIAGVLAAGGLGDGRGEESLAAIAEAAAALTEALASESDDITLAARAEAAAGSPAFARAALAVGDAVLLEPLPRGEEWLLALHAVRRHAARAAALAGLVSSFEKSCGAAPARDTAPQQP